MRPPLLAPSRFTPERKARRGVVTVELLLVLPVFLAMLLGLVGMADLLVTEQLLAEASGRAARAAALGGSEEQVKDAVRSVLGSERADRATIRVGPADGGTGPVPPGGLLEVRVEIEAQYATATNLAPIRSDELLLGRTVMQRE
jgi:Flp pilus assembly protein TadG